MPDQLWSASSAFTAEEHLIPVQGETVAATRYLPKGARDESRPVVLMYTPYRKDDYITFGGYHPTIRYLTEHGYNVVVADMVGTGASTGFKGIPFGPEEASNVVSVIDWIVERDWANGHVGMFGKSYNGYTCLKAAAEGHPNLDAIVPIHTNDALYTNYYENGLLAVYRTAGVWGPMFQVLQALPPSRRDSGGRWADVWETRLDGLRDGTPWLLQFLEHQREDSFWKRSSVPVEQITTPTLAVGGWRDTFVDDTVDFFEKISAEKRLLLGPWRHTMPHRGREVAIDFRRQLRDWFDHYLRGIDNGVDEQPKITAWTETDGGGKVEGGTWSGMETWPTLPDADGHLSLTLTQSGLQRGDGSFEELRRSYAPDLTVGLDSVDMYEQPLDTNADDVRSMTFETGALKQPLTVAGRGSATIQVSELDVKTELAIRIIDVSPDGTASLVTYGVAAVDSEQADNRNDPTEVVIPLKSKAHRFDRGHTIRVAISGSHFPEVRPVGQGRPFTLRSGNEAPSRVHLPHPQSGTGTSNTITMDDPTDHPPTHPEHVTDESVQLTTAREHMTGRGLVDKTEASVLDLPHTTVHYDADIEASVATSNPGSAVVSRTTEIALEYEHERIAVKTFNRVGQNTAQLTTKIRIDDETIFDEKWRL